MSSVGGRPDLTSCTCVLWECPLMEASCFCRDRLDWMGSYVSMSKG